MAKITYSKELKQNMFDLDILKHLEAEVDKHIYYNGVWIGFIAKALENLPLSQQTENIVVWEKPFHVAIKRPTNLLEKDHIMWGNENFKSIKDLENRLKDPTFVRGICKGFDLDLTITNAIEDTE